MTRVAAVDLGTNSTRLLVADVEDGRVDALVRRSVVTRLGEGVDARRRLLPVPVARVRNALTDFRRELEALGAERTLAVATSAVRDAENGEAFLGEVEWSYGFATRLLSGDEEAELTRAGVGRVAAGTRRRSSRGSDASRASCFSTESRVNTWPCTRLRSYASRPRSSAARVVTVAATPIASVGRNSGNRRCTCTAIESMSSPYSSVSRTDPTSMLTARPPTISSVEPPPTSRTSVSFETSPTPRSVSAASSSPLSNCVVNP